jgi:competence protein ComEC
LDHHSRSAGRETQAQVFCELRGFVDVIAPPTEVEGDLFSEINNNSVAILLTYGTARILLAGDAEANEEEYRVNGPYARP